MRGRRFTTRLNASACAPPTVTEQVSAACPVHKGAERGAPTAADTDALAPWLRLVDALADEAARRLWEGGAPMPAPQQVSAPRPASSRNRRRS